MSREAKPTELADQPRTIRSGGARVWIHAATVKGRFARLRNVVAVLLIAFLFLAPWLQVDGRPFMRLSFLSPSFVLFGRHVMIYEFHHFGLLALLLVLTLINASANFGRIWCGYACPQTVFIEQILGRIETFFEGPAAKRQAQVGKPMTSGRFARKAGKQAAYVVVCAAFSFTLVAWFTGPELILSGKSAGATTAASLLTGLAWFDGAYWREQFCHIVCPYGRLQSVMQDRATRTVGYDAQRGEPRRRGKDRAGAGDCIDCDRCVRVCPSGIDIRQGESQIECIGCTRCIDACDSVMTAMKKPKGLIRYDAVVMFGASPPKARPSLMRPRALVLASLWLALASLGIWQFVNRVPFHVQLLSTQSGVPFFVDGERIKNLSTLKIGNQGAAAETYEVRLEGEAAPSVRLESPKLLGPVPVGAESGMPILVSAPAALAGRSYTILVVASGTGVTRRVERRLLGPGKAGTP